MTPDNPRADGGEPDWLGDFFAGPTDEDRARILADLHSRSAQVRVNGWEPYRGLWSTGEVIGVAVVLGDDAELAALGETVQSACERWAFDLWGLVGGQADVDTDCAATRQWFLDVADQFESGHLQLALEFDRDSFRVDDEAVEGSDLDLRGLLSRAAESPTVRRSRTHRGRGVNRQDGAK